MSHYFTLKHPFNPDLFIHSNVLKIIFDLFPDIFRMFISYIGLLYYGATARMAQNLQVFWHLLHVCLHRGKHRTQHCEYI